MAQILENNMNMNDFHKGDSRKDDITAAEAGILVIAELLNHCDANFLINVIELSMKRAAEVTDLKTWPSEDPGQAQYHIDAIRQQIHKAIVEQLSSAQELLKILKCLNNLENVVYLYC